MTDENKLSELQSKTNPWKYVAIGALGLWLTSGYRAVTSPIVEQYTGKKSAAGQSILERTRDKVHELRSQYKTIDEVVPSGVPPSPQRNSNFMPTKNYPTIDEIVQPAIPPNPHSLCSNRRYAIDRIRPHGGRFTGVENLPGMTVKTYKIDNNDQYSNNKYSNNKRRLISAENGNGISVRTYVQEDFDGDGVSDTYEMKGGR